MVEGKLIFLSVVGLIGLFLVAAALIKPFKFLLRVLACFIVGGTLLFLANFILARIGLHVALNPLTILTAGLLQVPGLILLALLSYFFI
ncbi:MAG: pro-sigmaK processing inhibitor BofA family protein [Bacillota bacterium]